AAAGQTTGRARGGWRWGVVAACLMSLVRSGYAAEEDVAGPGPEPVDVVPNLSKAPPVLPPAPELPIDLAAALRLAEAENPALGAPAGRCHERAGRGHRQRYPPRRVHPLPRPSGRRGHARRPPAVGSRAEPGRANHRRVRENRPGPRGGRPTGAGRGPVIAR